jgi:biotin operon repressor
MSQYKELMSVEERQNLKNRLLKLTDNGSTGSPSELAKSLGIGERSVKRLVSELRGEGYNIVYSRHADSYIIRD